MKLFKKIFCHSSSNFSSKKLSQYQMKKLLFLSLLLIAFSCGEQNEKPNVPLKDQISLTALGLNGRVVNKLINYNSKLIAATDDGLYVSDFSSNWVKMGLQNTHVIDISIINANVIVCSVTDNLLQENPRLVQSLDFGQSWSVIKSNFGNGNPEIVHALQYNPKSNLLFATGYDALASSVDNGQTWVLKSGSWNAIAKGLFAININPANDEIWTGGQNGIESQVIQHSRPDGTLINDWNKKIPSPSTVETIVFKNDGSNQMIMGCEGGILSTKNDGLTWQNLYAAPEGTARFYYGLVFDNLNPKKIIAASFDKPRDIPQPLMLHVSNDLGATWDFASISIPEQFGGARCMIQTQENGQTVLYIGLYLGGVYKITMK